MLTQGMIFDEVKASSEFSFLKTKRLLTIQSDIYNQLDQLFTVGSEGAPVSAEKTPKS